MGMSKASPPRIATESKNPEADPLSEKYDPLKVPKRRIIEE